MPLYLIYLHISTIQQGDRELTTVELHFQVMHSLRAKEVVNQYSNKFKRLDKQYAADIVGNGDNGIVGPFESVQKRFIGGQVILLVVGPFGEVNKDFQKVLKTLARLAAAGEDGMSISISPLRNTDRKGGAFIIMLQQFRRALCVMVVRGMANHKLSRLH
eukprot:scaffold48318_cov51-Cyclotella_meneghiniana.AAC.2